MDSARCVTRRSSRAVHRAPLFALGSDFDRDLGARAAEYFRDTNLVLMASEPSGMPMVRNEGLHRSRVRQRALLLFRGILLHGVPTFWQAIFAEGGTIGDQPVVYEVQPLTPYYRTAHVRPPRVTAATLRGAEPVVDGLITTYTPGPDFVQLRRARVGLAANACGCRTGCPIRVRVAPRVLRRNRDCVRVPHVVQRRRPAGALSDCGRHRRVLEWSPRVAVTDRSRRRSRPVSLQPVGRESRGDHGDGSSRVARTGAGAAGHEPTQPTSA